LQSGDDAYLLRMKLSHKHTLSMNPTAVHPTLKTPSSPSTVVLLQNLVGPGEVDDDLHVETAEECARFGKVEKCVVYELQRPKRPEEAVRVFVKFHNVDSAVQGKRSKI
jgi:hypothetical protein